MAHEYSCLSSNAETWELIAPVLSGLDGASGLRARGLLPALSPPVHLPLPTCARVSNVAAGGREQGNDWPGVRASGYMQAWKVCELDLPPELNKGPV